jgi:hypothetical protein
MLCSHIFIIHNDHTYITEDYTSLCLNIICNRSFFFLNDVSFVPVRVLHKDEKILGRKHIYLPHAQTAIYDSKKKLFLKQGISCQLGRGWTQLFDLNARIQQLTWSLIFYEKYSTSQSYLWFWPPLILGGSVISDGTIHDLKRVKVPGTGPLWNPWGWIYYIQRSI